MQEYIAIPLGLILLTAYQIYKRLGDILEQIKRYDSTIYDKTKRGES